jgi:hypothetical protein
MSKTLRHQKIKPANFVSLAGLISGSSGLICISSGLISGLSGLIYKSSGLISGLSGLIYKSSGLISAQRA